MAKMIQTKATILLHDLDLSGYSNVCSIPATIDDVDATNYASGGWKERLAGLRDAEWNAEGFLSEESEKLLELMARTRLQHPMSASNERPIAAADVAYFSKFVGLRYDRREQIGAMRGWAINAKEVAPLVRGVCLETVTRTVTANGADLDLGVAIADGERLYYAVHVLAASTDGDETLDLVLESDTTGFGSPTTRATLAQFTGKGSAFGYVDGPVTDTFWRVAATVGGAGTPSFTYVFLIGRAPLNA